MLGRSRRLRHRPAPPRPAPPALPLRPSLPVAPAASCQSCASKSLSPCCGLSSLAARQGSHQSRAFPFLPSGATATWPGAFRSRSLAARSLTRAPARPGPHDAPLGEHDFRGHGVRAQRFRFSEEPGPGADGAVLEVHVPQIGAGVSLPGILAAKCGAEVILSDSSELPHCLEVCRQSCQMNNLPHLQVVGLTWGHVSWDLLALPPQDIILASDVFFEPEDFEDILATMYFLMHKNPKVQLWSTYQVRSADWSLEALLYKWDMKCVHIPLESFDADKEDIAESTLPGRHTVEMLVISFAKDSL
ncbi:histone-arginine methyltransferase METTL23 isoform X3 [Symphalangus syndactylus]|uniref:histone-arginine methyltransferase METTL23 isoform X3 n=1 Tax=Symphalangus syndactylus TaxID=9590 RepID=UPI00244232B5|nr:histone-arginine methyltransferase METTL23 isoform X3 [Symphalangus syndactylus]